MIKKTMPVNHTEIHQL